MKAVLVLGLCVIALCCALPVDDEQEREKRSSSGEHYRGRYGGPIFYPNPDNNNNNVLNALLPLLIARLFPVPVPIPVPAPPPPPPPPPPPGK
ncbi:RNA-binding protein 33-like [Pygocentrus nattereri]|uniref:RNA-binding protein 33-like n=1 Tax=Pygocentrus nattereri TaxID=42514 RepID=UPI0018917522|nr:RNA-binding protein 33-like [Pygocentrus nattereri]XP_037388710.1 RNA-binding protein 33-like [Pygocentrus nattereri]